MVNITPEGREKLRKGGQKGGKAKVKKGFAVNKEALKKAIATRTKGG